MSKVIPIKNSNRSRSSGIVYAPYIPLYTNTNGNYPIVSSYTKMSYRWGLFYSGVIKNLFIRNWTPSSWNLLIEKTVNWLGKNTILFRPHLMTRIKYLKTRKNQKKLIKYKTKQLCVPILYGTLRFNNNNYTRSNLYGR